GALTGGTTTPNDSSTITSAGTAGASSSGAGPDVTTATATVSSNPDGSATQGTASGTTPPATDASANPARGPPSPWVTTLSDTTTNAVTISASGSDLQLTVDGVTTSRPIASVSAVTIAGGALSDSLTIATPVSVSVTFNGGAGNDTVYGAPADATWMITGAGAGYAGNLSFTGV